MYRQASVTKTQQASFYQCDRVGLSWYVFVENVWPANLALFIYVSTHCVETVKWIDYNWHSQLTRWCSGNASAFGCKRFRVQFPAPSRVLSLMLCSVVVVLLLFFSPKTHYLSQKFAIHLTMLIYLVYLTYCKICDRLYNGIKIQTEHL